MRQGDALLTPRQRLLVGVLVVAIVVSALDYLYREPCWDILPCRDSPRLVSSEERELLLRAQEAYDRSKALPRRYRGIVTLPEPLRVRVSKREATLGAGGPIAPGDLQYAAAWYDVYHRHHRGIQTVYMRVVWESGSEQQQYPLSEF